MGITRRAQKHPYLYLPDGWDTGWKAAKAASATTPCWITAVGDSVTYGTGATTPDTGGWFARCRTSLLTGLGRYADYYQIASDTTGAPSANFTVSANSALGTVGYGLTTSFAGAATGIVTFVTPYACTAVDLVYHDRVAGTWQYTVDGGAPVTVTQTATAAIKSVQIRSLSSAVHTIVVSNQSATNVLNMCGATAYASTTAGVGFANLGIGSLQSSAWLATTQARHLQGWQSSGSVTGFGFPSQPHLAILAMGLNDCANSNVGPDQYMWCYSRIIESLRRGRAGCSIVLCAWNDPSSIFSDTTTPGSSFAEDWWRYVVSMRTLANKYNCAFVNMHAKWGEYAVANGYLNNASVHPTDAGYLDIATELLKVI